MLGAGGRWWPLVAAGGRWWPLGPLVARN